MGICKKMKIHISITDDKNQTYEGIAELTKSKKQRQIKHIAVNPKGPTDIIKEFYHQNYFETNKTLNEVEKKIKTKKYNFDLPAITLALSRAKYLKRNGTRGKYSYIQKSPPS